MRRAFEACDRKHDGVVDEAELTAALRDVAPAVLARALMRAGDTRGDGRLSYDEFARVFEMFQYGDIVLGRAAGVPRHSLGALAVRAAAPRALRGSFQG